jgi:cation:H+ antiporter
MEEMLVQFFEARSSLVLLLILAGSIAVLVKGADFLVDGAVGLSERLGIPKVIIGATVVSLGTTCPEAGVSVLAAFQGSPDLALGNAVGSIICDTGLIFGLGCLLTRLPKDRFVLNRHGWVQFGSGLLLVVLSLLFWNAEGTQRILPRFIGFFLIVLLVGYMGVSVYWARRHRDAGLEAMVDNVDENLHKIAKKDTTLIDVVLLLVGLLLVLAASHVAVPNVQVLCIRWSVPKSVVSATLVAFGTSLPELVTAITSIYKGQKEILIGNILGADILNVLFVTGASACAASLTIDPLFYKLHFPVMMAVLILFRLNIFIGGKTFARWPGFIFLGLHLAYVFVNYLIGRK